MNARDSLMRGTQLKRAQIVTALLVEQHDYHG